MAIRRRDEGPEDPSINRPAIGMLRMPLNPEHECTVIVLTGLDRAVLGKTGDLQGTRIGNSLMMRGVHHQGRGFEHRGDQRARCEVGPVVDELSWTLAVGQRRNVRKVLVQGAPVGNGHHLQAPADAEDRQVTVPRTAVQLQLG